MSPLQIPTGTPPHNTKPHISGHLPSPNPLQPAKLRADEALERYASRLYKVQNGDKTPYDHVEFDSDVEHRFAKALDHNEDIRFYLKLPPWFTVDTPIGPYNPDWAIMFESETKLYLVRETKESFNAADRREPENIKVNCAMSHFAAIDVNYNVVRNMDDLAAQVAS